MVLLYHVFKIPISWWEYADTSSKQNKDGTYAPNTEFRMIRLDADFAKEHDKILKAHRIVREEDQKTKQITYRIV